MNNIREAVKDKKGLLKIMNNKALSLSTPFTLPFTLGNKINQEPPTEEDIKAYGGTIMNKNKTKNRKKCAFGMTMPQYQTQAAYNQLGATEAFAGNTLRHC
jgi:hypothetical protein